METQVREIKIGNRVKIRHSYHEKQFSGKIGRVVTLRTAGEIGIDFNEVIGTLTWDLDGALTHRTGRFISYDGIEIIPDDWDI